MATEKERLKSVKIKEVVSALERFAPLPLQEGFDNAGLQVGLTEAEVSGALLCLDVTERIVDEAVEKGCNLIISHHPLVFRPLKNITGSNDVQRFAQRGENLDDLFQVGCIGLIKAIDNFDPAQPVRFSTYGVPMIIGEIRRFLRDNNTLRVSRTLRDTAYRAMQARETLEKQLGREPTMDEIAAAAGLARREVTAALESVVEPLSLDEPVYTDGGDAMYVIDQVRDPDSEESWISGLQFRDTVAALSPREKRIMELRYLRGKTQMEVAQEIGISQAQVSRLEKGALQQFHTEG